MARVLLIDDDLSVNDAIKSLLEISGYEVFCMTNSKGLFGIIDEFKPDVVLMDYLLRGENGGELCQLIKGNPLTSGLPVILNSAAIIRFDPVTTYNCDMFLEKPFDVDELTESIAMFHKPHPNL